MPAPTDGDPARPTPDLPAPVRLPGVGALLDLRDEDGAPLRVVTRKDGNVEIHHEGATIVLDATQAHALGAFVTGHYVLDPTLARRIGGVLGGLQFDWVTVPPGAAVAGRSIQDVQLRQRTGVTVVAILRGSQPVVDPGPQAILEVGDDLVVACRDEERASLEQFLREGP